MHTLWDTPHIQTVAANLKMKKFSTIILFFLPFLTWAHQDTYYTYEYNNVTVRFKTGFWFEEINNTKIIGQFAAILSDSLGYDNPILLDFIHDYGYSYQGRTISFLNFGSQKYDLVSYYMKDSIEDDVYHIIPFSDTVESINNVEKEIYTVPEVNRRRTIVIRQFGFHFDLTQTINLLYHAITNKREVKELSQTDTLSSYLRNTYYQLETIPSKLIDSVKVSTSTYVKQVLQNKVYREVGTVDRHQLYYSYFSKNGEYLIFAGLHDKEVVLDTLDKIYSFNPRELIPEVLFVFETPNLFRKYELDTWVYPEYKPERSERHQVPIDPYEKIVHINIEWIGDDMYLINYNSSFMYSPFAIFPYLEKDDVLIEDFEKYINSYRKEQK
jgi:hypothetical protein